MSANGSSMNHVEEGIPANDKQPSSRLSMVSKMYDVDGDGKLDEAEQRMRDLDTEGVGHLSNAKVYSIFQQQLAMQKQLLMAKRIIIFLAVFLVILAIANVGVAFAAARLAQDTTTDTNVLVVKETGEVVATDTYVHTFDLGLPEESQRRLLEDPDGFFSDSICSPCTIGIDNQTSLMIRQHCMNQLPVTVRLFYVVPTDAGLTKEHLTSYQVCNSGATEDIVTEGTGQIRDGTPEVVTKFTITDTTNVAPGSGGRRRRLNGDDDVDYVFEGGLSGPWLFSTQNIPPIPTASTAATTTSAATTTAAP